MNKFIKQSKTFRCHLSDSFDRHKIHRQVAEVGGGQQGPGMMHQAQVKFP